jgi:hypothetical protein
VCAFARVSDLTFKFRAREKEDGPWRWQRAASVGGEEERQESREGVEGQIETQAVPTDDPRVEAGLAHARHLRVGVAARHKRHLALVVPRHHVDLLRLFLFHLPTPLPFRLHLQKTPK